MNACHSTGVHFSYSNRADKLKSFSKVAGGPEIKIKLDLNDTRTSSRKELIYSLLRMLVSIRAYVSSQPNNTCSWEITNDTWETVAEFESVFEIIKIVTVFVQNEKKYTASLRYSILQKLMEQLRGNTINTIDLTQVNTSPKLVRWKKNITVFRNWNNRYLSS